MVNLEHFYRGKLIRTGQAVGDFVTMATSPGIDRHKADEIFSVNNIGSYNNVSNIKRLTYGIALLQSPDGDHVLLHVYPSKIIDRGHVIPVYHCALIPQNVYAQFKGDIPVLLKAIAPQEPAPVFEEYINDLEYLELNPDARANKSTASLSKILSSLKLTASSLLYLFSALIGDHNISIIGAPREPEKRLDCVQAILHLFPSLARSSLTFATEVFDGDTCKAKIKFLFDNALPGKNDYIMYYDGFIFKDNPSLNPYASLVAQAFAKEPESIYSYVASLDDRYENIYKHTPSHELSLNLISKRIQTDAEIASGQMSAGNLANLIRTDTTLTDLEIKYYSQLLLNLAIKSEDPGSLHILIEKNLTSTLANRLADWMIQKIQEGYGQRVLTLMAGWLGDPGLQSNKKYWIEFTQKSILEYLNRLVREEDENNSLKLIKYLRDNETFAIIAPWPKIITHLWAFGCKSSLLAPQLIFLVAWYNEDKLLDLISDKSIRSILHRDLGILADMINQKNPALLYQPGLLVDACLNSGLLGADRYTLLFKLANICIQTRAFLLLDFVFWQQVSQCTAVNDWYKDQAIQLSRTFEDNAMVKNLALDSTFGLVNFRLACNQEQSAIKLLVTAKEHWAEKSTIFSTLLEKFFHNDARISNSNINNITSSVVNSSLDTYHKSIILLAILDRNNWQFCDAIFEISRLRMDHPDLIAMDDNQILRLIQCLAREEKEPMKMTEWELRQSVSRALEKPQFTNKADSLSIIATTIQDNPRVRKKLTTLVYEYCRTLNNKELEKFNKQLLIFNKELEPEISMTNALLSIAKVLGSQDIPAFAEKIAITSEVLFALNEAFTPPDTQPYANINWKVFKLALENQLISLPLNYRKDIGNNCFKLSKQLSSVSSPGKINPVAKLFSSPKKSNDDLYYGKANPENVIEGLIWLAGLFNNAQK
jgi:hypothetical protein